jgi:hypothetical protein
LVGLALGDGAPYSFNYEANDEGQHQRNEQGEHGQVQGSYSYIDPNGHLRQVITKSPSPLLSALPAYDLSRFSFAAQVNYVADEDGFRPSGDIGVDRETEAAGNPSFSLSSLPLVSQLI